MYMYNNVCLNIFVVFVICVNILLVIYDMDLIYFLIYVSYGFKICLVFYFLIWCVLKIVCVLMYIVNDK